MQQRSPCDSPTKTCTLDDCPRPLRARGLCGTHYNQQHQPNRHRPVTIPCDYCGTPVQKQVRQDFKHRFCSLTCRDAKRRADQAPVTAARVEAKARAEQKARRVAAALQRQARAAQGTSGAAAWVSGPCVHCGRLFTCNQPRARTCRRRCTRAITRSNYRRKYGRLDRNRQRARHYGVRYEPISAAAIYQRDNWRCQLCGHLTDRTAKVPSPNAPTIDHVIPMSLGGDHTPVNVQCAHFLCNTRKGTRGTQQLRLA